MLLKGKKAVIFGVANTHSIAYGIASAFRREGAELAFSYLNDALRKRVMPISDELGGAFTFPCDVALDEDVTNAADLVQKEWGSVDVIVHSVAFAAKDDLKGRFLDTSRKGFQLALDISAFSLVAICKAFEPLLHPGSSVLCMTYYGAQKMIPNYNVMGVAKAALESSVRYLATDLGSMNVRINAISAGPIRTLASSGISGFHHIGDMFTQRAPIKHLVSIDEIGNAAVFLASDLSSAVTGEVLYADNGFQSTAL